MFSYRITKYDPKFRDAKGIYHKNEWISFSDIDSIFEGVKLTADKYIQVENIYISAIHSFMNALNLEFLNVSRLEKDRYSLTQLDTKYPELDSEQITKTIEAIQNGNSLAGNNLNNFCKLCLRSKAWGVLEHNSKMFVHFGRDYYMYIGVSEDLESVIEQVKATGLFVENFKSPYLNQ
jgi:hypothetical protein